MNETDTESFGGLLERLGVREDTLTLEERQSLEEEGYLVLPRVLDAKWLNRLRESFERDWEYNRTLMAESGKRETGTRHLSELLGRGEEYERIALHPKLLAAAKQILGTPFRLSGFDGRDPLPGFGQQGIHADWTPRHPSDPYVIANSLWLLDDYTPVNGATRIVPGSHRLPGMPDKALSDPNRRHPQQVIVTAPAGSVLIFNGHLWHSGTKNYSQDSRRTIRCTFMANNASPYMEPFSVNALISPDLSAFLFNED